MAPESERAKLNSGNHWECGDAYVVCECGGWNSKAWQEKNRCYFSHARPLFRVNEPTLPCSEVVERLFQEAYEPNTNYAESDFDRAKAEAILHSWRERRVQELEEALREMIDKHGVHSGECFSCDFFVREVGHHSGDCPIPSAEKLLAKSDEWREQIRKGAKHE